MTFRLTSRPLILRKQQHITLRFFSRKKAHPLTLITPHPSTTGQKGRYSGDWCDETSLPDGHGTMIWDNGIAYEGAWFGGLFHGKGSLTYSRGGGYTGNWVQSQRTGEGTQYFSGKFGYNHWSGNFTSDKPDGVGVMEFVGKKEPSEKFEFDMGEVVSTTEEYETFDGEVTSIDDGSPSTMGVKGRYNGGWKDGKPWGFGKMNWENGIEYKGMWKDGKYHGHGRKLYSRGGGYEGSWVSGLRSGFGISFYNDESLGKFGILRWEGQFENNLAHGEGQAYVKAPETDELGRWEGDTAIKGPKISFVNGQPTNFP